VPVVSRRATGAVRIRPRRAEAVAAPLRCCAALPALLMMSRRALSAQSAFHVASSCTRCVAVHTVRASRGSARLSCTALLRLWFLLTPLFAAAAREATFQSCVSAALRRARRRPTECIKGPSQVGGAPSSHHLGVRLPKASAPCRQTRAFPALTAHPHEQRRSEGSCGVARVVVRRGAKLGLAVLCVDAPRCFLRVAPEPPLRFAARCTTVALMRRPGRRWGAC
jgi:hypothetical protein